MSVNSKHVATFLLGAAAALAASKYMSMTPEEKEKLAGDIKDKANKIKDEAEHAVDKAREYFEELKTKGAEAFKEHFADAEKMMGELFAKKDEPKAAS
jgi:ElaB/YqjD/DUF883 family membrane-anchored ribosome-binding protein